MLVVEFSLISKQAHYVKFAIEFKLELADFFEIIAEASLWHLEESSALL